MPRSKAADAAAQPNSQKTNGLGHEGAALPPKDHNAKGLTREERRALLSHHINTRLRPALAAIEEARVPFDAAKENFTALVNEAKADLGKGYTRKRFMALLEDLGSRLRDLLTEEQQRFEDRVDLGLPVFGQQVDLFGGPETPQEKKDEAFWFAEGALAGRRAGERKGPEGCPPRMDQDYLRGYDAGQAEVGHLFIEASDLIAKRGQPSDAAPVNLAPEPEPGTEEAKSAERKSIAKAKDSLASMGAANEQAA